VLHHFLLFVFKGLGSISVKDNGTDHGSVLFRSDLAGSKRQTNGQLLKVQWA
jgi:hypothetical protein